jgi:CheY-like chemotaxis protein
MILIVEDDPLSRRALQFLLASKGYTSRAVGSAEEALDVLHSAEQAGGRTSPRQPLPEMLLIDVDLPGMSGVQLVKCVQALHPRLPCTLMSANHQELLQRDPATARTESPGSLAAPRRHVPFLPKPLDFGKLMTVVRQHA